MASRTRAFNPGTLTNPDALSAATVLPAADPRVASLASGSMGGAQSWQDELWDLVTAVPEAENGMLWLAEGASRATIYPARITEEGVAGDRTTDLAVLRATQGVLSPQRSPEFLRAAARFRFVPGEAYLFGYDDPLAIRPSERRQWNLLDPNNVRDAGSSFTVKYARNGRETQTEVSEVLSEEGVRSLSLPLVRIWNPDDRKPWEARSPIIALADVLRALVKLTRLVPALSDQRIAGPRILAISDRVEPPPSSPQPRVKFSDDPLVNRLAQAVDQAKRDPSSLDNLLAIILKGDLSEKTFEKLEWDTQFPQLTVEIMDILIKRVALGLPLPPAITLGDGETSHWGQWFNEESAVKLSIEPTVAWLCNALTRYWLPYVLPPGYNPDEWVVGYDVRSVMLRPDRSAIAIQLYDRGILSAQATRRETGMSENDKPSPEEVAERQALMPGDGDGTPGPDPGQASRNPSQQTDLDTTGDRGNRELPTRALEAAAAIAVRTALGKVGRKIGTTDRTLREATANMRAYEVHTRVAPEMRGRVDLSVMWPDGVLEEFVAAAAEMGYDPDCAENAIKAHLKSCVDNGRAHDSNILAARISACSGANLDS